jgi:hypothetical protein
MESRSVIKAYIDSELSTNVELMNKVRSEPNNILKNHKRLKYIVKSTNKLIKKCEKYLKANQQDEEINQETNNIKQGLIYINESIIRSNQDIKSKYPLLWCIYINIYI